mgnify:CR=1 FL=1
MADVYGATIADSELIVTLENISKSLPRKLIIAGSRDTALSEGVIRIQSNILSLLDLPELISLPLEHIGGELIKRYCQNENFYKPMSKAAEDC